MLANLPKEKIPANRHNDGFHLLPLKSINPCDITHQICSYLVNDITQDTLPLCLHSDVVLGAVICSKQSSGANVSGCVFYCVGRIIYSQWGHVVWGCLGSHMLMAPIFSGHTPCPSEEGIFSPAGEIGSGFSGIFCLFSGPTVCIEMCIWDCMDFIIFSPFYWLT